MRITPVLVVAVLVAGPACAQDAFSRDRELAIQAEQQMARPRMNALQTEIHALEGQSRTEQTVRELQNRREPLRVVPGDNPPPSAPPAGYASIPDAALAESNARVRAASGRGR